ncbi:MAG TPA: class I SAM-dependent rRNA methyltransferase [Candidatus Krumholzibacteria bacterium]|nr:class I SAM-dependent rRNA methyltransferase [Candidatus Krumholzibacteria bacterium]
MATVTLDSKRDRATRHRHPWIFAASIASVTGNPAPGDVVDVVDARGVLLGRGYHNEHSRIRVRVLTWDDRPVDDAFWRARVEAAIRRRGSLALGGDTNAYRLIHAEADLLPGLIADRYGDVVVVQVLTAGIERARDVVVDALASLTEARCLYERSDTASRTREGLPAVTGAIRGEAPRNIEVLENGHTFLVNIESGQKTGFYLDQRDNRAWVAAHAQGCDVLDAFCHTGAFAVYCARAGAKSLSLIDSSAPSLGAARWNLERNGTGECAVAIQQADVFEELRAMRDAGRRFDLVVLDPPKFASNKHQVEKALRAYKDVNLLAMQLLVPDGLLATFSCSQAVDADSFTMAVSWAGVDAARDVQIIRRMGQGIDHPILATFPESEYLKGLLCRVA